MHKLSGPQTALTYQALPLYGVCKQQCSIKDELNEVSVLQSKQIADLKELGKLYCTVRSALCAHAC